jgi:hypothetical protein
VGCVRYGIGDDVSDVRVGERVRDLATAATRAHQVVLAEHTQVLRDEWLGNEIPFVRKGIDDLVDAHLGVRELLQDRQTHW